MGELTRLPVSKTPMQMFQERISLWLTLGRRRLESGSLFPVRRSRPNRFQQRRTRRLLQEHRTDLNLPIGSIPLLRQVLAADLGCVLSSDVKFACAIKNL